MIGGGNGSKDLSNYLINFNSADWANQANAQLQIALQQGLNYSEKYAQQAATSMQDYNNQSQRQMLQGFNQSQALSAPQHLVTYGALDKYAGLLGVPTPVGGSFQLAGAMENAATGQSNTAQQNQKAAGYNQGLLSPIQKPQGY